MGWTCAGRLGVDTLPAIKFIARLSTSLGVKLIMSWETWIPTDPYFRPILQWAAFLPVRTRIPNDALLWGLRAHSGNLESLSFWMLERP